MTKKSKKVYVLHHTLQGTPERGMIHGIYPTKKACLTAMKEELIRGYDGVTMRENEEQDYIYMYWSEHDSAEFNPIRMYS